MSAHEPPEETPQWRKAWQDALEASKDYDGNELLLAMLGRYVNASVEHPLQGLQAQGVSMFVQEHVSSLTEGFAMASELDRVFTSAHASGQLQDMINLVDKDAATAGDNEAANYQFHATMLTLVRARVAEALAQAYLMASQMPGLLSFEMHAPADEEGADGEEALAEPILQLAGVWFGDLLTVGEAAQVRINGALQKVSDEDLIKLNDYYDRHAAQTSQQDFELRRSSAV